MPPLGGGMEIIMSKKEGAAIVKSSSEMKAIVPAGNSDCSKRKLVILVAVTVILGILMFAGCRSGIWERFVSFAVGRGLGFESGESQRTEETQEETENEESKEMTVSSEISESDSVEEYTREESETLKEEKANIVEMDLSQSNSGDFYILDEYGKVVDADNLSDADFEGAREYYSDSPVVLILHSHTSELYFDGNNDIAVHSITKSVVSVGDMISARLNKNGVPTVHCTVIHDKDSKIDSYAKASETLKTMLEIYPTIKYVIDLHRASLFDDDGRCVKTLSGVGSAQVRMLVDSENGGEQPLILASLIRQKLNYRDARVAMPVVYSGGLPLGEASLCFMKLEVGSYGNLTSEAVTAGELFADAFAAVVKGK